MQHLRAVEPQRLQVRAPAALGAVSGVYRCGGLATERHAAGGGGVVLVGRQLQGTQSKRGRDQRTKRERLRAAYRSSDGRGSVCLPYPFCCEETHSPRSVRRRTTENKMIAAWARNAYVNAIVTLGIGSSLQRYESSSSIPKNGVVRRRGLPRTHHDPFPTLGRFPYGKGPGKRMARV